MTTELRRSFVIVVLGAALGFLTGLLWFRVLGYEKKLDQLRVDVMSLHFASTAVAQAGVNPLDRRGQVATGILRQAVVERWLRSPIVSDREIAALASRSLIKADEAIRRTDEKK